tara:strand:+ start:32794 stop:33504 length:711 start_codon:yes stop_codon:yes gene_type:complete
MLKINKLSKSYTTLPSGFFNNKGSKKTILKNLSFNTEEGDCIALLGKNGCGKTTLLKLISGVLALDKGSINNNFDKPLDFSLISMVNSNDRSFFWRLSVKENLKFFCSLSNKDSLEKIEETLILLNVFDKIDFPFMSLSYGERKKISIARALLKDSKILLLDEITSSLDISAKKIMISTLKDLLKKNHLQLIIFTTHSLDEVVRLSNRFLFIKDKAIFIDQKVNENTRISDIESKF